MLNSEMELEEILLMITTEIHLLKHRVLELPQILERLCLLMAIQMVTEH